MLATTRLPQISPSWGDTISLPISEVKAYQLTVHLARRRQLHGAGALLDLAQ